MSDTDNTGTTPAGINLDQSVEEMLDVVGTAARALDEAKEQAEETFNEKTEAIDAATQALSETYNNRTGQLTVVRNEVQAAYNRATRDADDAYNLTVHGDKRGPKFDRYGGARY